MIFNNFFAKKETNQNSRLKNLEKNKNFSAGFHENYFIAKK